MIQVTKPIIRIATEEDIKRRDEVRAKVWLDAYLSGED